MRPTVRDALNVVRNAPRHDVLVLRDYRDGYTFIVSIMKVERRTLRCVIQNKEMTEEQLIQYAIKLDKTF